MLQQFSYYQINSGPPPAYLPQKKLKELSFFNNDYIHLNSLLFQFKLSHSFSKCSKWYEKALRILFDIVFVLSVCPSSRCRSNDNAPKTDLLFSVTSHDNKSYSRVECIMGHNIFRGRRERLANSTSQYLSTFCTCGRVYTPVCLGDLSTCSVRVIVILNSLMIL